jgi:hypothetical protein
MHRQASGRSLREASTRPDGQAPILATSPAFASRRTTRRSAARREESLQADPRQCRSNWCRSENRTGQGRPGDGPVRAILCGRAQGRAGDPGPGIGPRPTTRIRGARRASPTRVAAGRCPRAGPRSARPTKTAGQRPHSIFRREEVSPQRPQSTRRGRRRGREGKRREKNSNLNQTEPPPAGSRWVRQSAESPTDRVLGSHRPRHPTTPKESHDATRNKTYWKWSPGRRGILDPRVRH